MDQYRPKDDTASVIRESDPTQPLRTFAKNHCYVMVQAQVHANEQRARLDARESLCYSPA